MRVTLVYSYNDCCEEGMNFTERLYRKFSLFLFEVNMQFSINKCLVKI